MKKVCCGFGHSNLHTNKEKELEMMIEKLISYHNVKTFMTGDMGKFDKMFSSAVRTAKRKHKDIKLILVLPYLSVKINKYKDYYENFFDEIILPEDLIRVHYKRAITERNKWMINNSDYVLTCVYREGGAFTAMKYAEKTGKLYYNFPV